MRYIISPYNPIAVTKTSSLPEQTRKAFPISKQLTSRLQKGYQTFGRVFLHDCFKFATSLP